MPFKPKYSNNEERREAVRASKREWARRNKKRLKAYHQEWYRRRKEKLKRRELYTREDLIANVDEIKRDFETMKNSDVEAKWGRHRTTLKKMVKEYAS